MNAGIIAGIVAPIIVLGALSAYYLTKRIHDDVQMEAIMTKIQENACIDEEYQQTLQRQAEAAVLPNRLRALEHYQDELNKEAANKFYSQRQTRKATRMLKARLSKRARTIMETKRVAEEAREAAKAAKEAKEAAEAAEKARKAEKEAREAADTEAAFNKFEKKMLAAGSKKITREIMSGPFTGNTINLITTSVPGKYLLRTEHGYATVTLIEN